MLVRYAWAFNGGTLDVVRLCRLGGSIPTRLYFFRFPASFLRSRCGVNPGPPCSRYGFITAIRLHNARARWALSHRAPASRDAPPPLGGRGDLSTSVGLLVPAVAHRSPTGRPPVVSSITPIFIDDTSRHVFFDALQRKPFRRRPTWNGAAFVLKSGEIAATVFGARHNAAQL